MENTTKAKIFSTVQALLALVSVIALVDEGHFLKVAAAGPPNACSSSATSLSVCLPAVQGDSPPFRTDACCTVVRSNDTGCLCIIVSLYSGAISSMNVNVSATLLPQNCKLILPVGFNCDGNALACT